MTGIIFTGGEGPEPETIKRNLDGIGNLFIVAADSGLALAERAGFQPDIIVGDMDSVDTQLLDRYPEESIIRYPAAKDYTDTELAMQEVLKRGCQKIWIIGGGGGRLEHLLGIRSLFERYIFPVRWITKTEDVYCIDSVYNEQCNIRGLKSSIPVSVFPLGDTRWKAHSTGLKWQLNDLDWSRGFFGLSNTALEGDFSVTAVSGRFLIIIGSE